MKKFIMAILVGCLCGSAFAEMATVTIAASGGLTGTWVNTLSPKRDVELKSAFVANTAMATNDTVTLSVSFGGTSYVVGTSGPYTNTSTSVGVDKKIFVGYGETVTVTRTAAYTNTTKALLVVQ